MVNVTTSGTRDTVINFQRTVPVVCRCVGIVQGQYFAYQEQRDGQWGLVFPVH